MGSDINQQLTGRHRRDWCGDDAVSPRLRLAHVALQLSARCHRVAARAQAQAEQKAVEASGDAGKQVEERPEDYLRVDQLEVQVGYQLVPLVDANQETSWSASCKFAK